MIAPDLPPSPAEDRLTRAWTPALGAWWARERARHVAMVVAVWETLAAEGEDLSERPTVLETCRSILMSGRELGLVFLDLDGLAAAGARAWDADLLVNVLTIPTFQVYTGENGQPVLGFAGSEWATSAIGLALLRRLTADLLKQFKGEALRDQTIGAMEMYVAGVLYRLKAEGSLYQDDRGFWVWV